jgi:hypothetical protein
VRSRLPSAAMLRLVACAAFAFVALLAVPVSTSAAPAPSGRQGTVSSAAERAVGAVTPNFSTDCTFTSLNFTGINVRSGPSTSFGVVGTVGPNQSFASPGCPRVNTQSVSACGFTEVQWDGIVFQGQVRWVSDDCFFQH